MDKFNYLSFMFLILQGLFQTTLAYCTQQELNIQEGFTLNPRPGIHYAVIPISNYFIDDPQSKCPSGSSVTYIKSQEEWEDWKFIQALIQAYTIDCKIGDGTGGSEEWIGTYTKENCITAVREQYPTANGATMYANCPSTCSCYAEFGMTSWVSSPSFQSCMFKIEGTCEERSKGQILQTFDNWGNTFKIEFDIKVDEAAPQQWVNVFHFTNGEDCCLKGSRIPAFYIWKPRRFVICTAIDNSGNYYWTNQFDYGQKYHFEISQDANGFFKIIRDGQLLIEIQNSQPQDYNNVKAYLSDPWYAEFLGCIENFQVSKDVESSTSGSTSRIKHIKIETSSENNANCNRCLKLEVCQSGSCCETRKFNPIRKGEIKSLSNYALEDCKDFPIDETLAIEFTFNHQKNNDDWKGVEATVHLHQHEQDPYICPISTWLNHHESYHTTCESPFASAAGETDAAAADSTSSCAYQIGENDEYCDDDNNNIGCNWDGGACCGDNVKKKYCYYCECLDPDFQGNADGTGNRRKRNVADNSCPDNPSSGPELSILRNGDNTIQIPENVDLSTHVAAVRCCSMNGQDCMTPSECFITTYDEAQKKCEDIGRRLCTDMEISVCCGTGCGFDSELTWHSPGETAAEVAINSYFDTENKKLTEDKFCIDISDNCQNVVKNFDGTDWKFFDDMLVDFQKREKCIKLTKDNTIAVTGCDEINHMVCRLDCSDAICNCPKPSNDQSGNHNSAYPVHVNSYDWKFWSISELHPFDPTDTSTTIISYENCNIT